MKLTHAVMWNEEAKMFRCRWGACNFEIAWDQMVDAGYTPSKQQVKFVSEENFDGPQTD